MTAAEQPSTSYRAVLIGIDNYPARPLGGCVNDIDQVEDLLLERLRVAPERITRLTAPRDGAPSTARLHSAMPTLAALRACLENLAQTATPDDRIFLYYSGHGAQVRTQAADLAVAREALVPVDMGMPDGGYLYDYEINSLLARIAARAADLTLVLDCCHSGSVTRADDSKEQEHVRFYPSERIEVLQQASAAPAFPSLTRDSGGLAATGATAQGAGDAAWMVVAACRANELAREVPMSPAAPGRFQGALTHVFMEILRNVEARRLPDLRWGELWPALLGGVEGVSSQQHPFLLGHGERRVFGGPWAPRDLGYMVRPSSSGPPRRVEIGAGYLTGVTPGALVGIYGPEPDRFPPLGSAEDRSARRGSVRIVEAARGDSQGEPVDGFDPTANLPAGARARLVEAGPPDRLIVSLEPPDPALARQLEALGATVLPPGQQPGAAELEVRPEGNDLLLCDAAHDNRRAADSPYLAPLLRIVGGHAGVLERALRHYARYNQVLRLTCRCLDLPGALKVSLLACPSPEDLAAAELADPQLDELERNAAGIYKTRENSAQFVIRIENRSTAILHAWAFNCTGSGRVELLGKETLAPSSPRIFWQHGRVREPFAAAVGSASTAALDRLVLVATTNANVDLDYLELPDSIDEATRDRNVTRDSLSPGSPPVEAWTAVQVPLLITRW